MQQRLPVPGFSITIFFTVQVFLSTMVLSFTDTTDSVFFLVFLNEVTTCSFFEKLSRISYIGFTLDEKNVSRFVKKISESLQFFSTPNARDTY